MDNVTVFVVTPSDIFAGFVIACMLAVGGFYLAVVVYEKITE